MAFNSGGARPFGELKLLGVAIRNLARPGIAATYHYHSGLLYRHDTAGPVALLHFLEHQDLKSEPPAPEFFWDDCALDDINSLVVARFCALIAGNIGRDFIPYGISYSGDYFDKASGRYKKRGLEEGLTCATLIVAVFDTMGFEILDRREWKRRPEDDGFFDWITDVMRRNWKVPEARVRAQKKLIGKAVRIRPQEAVSAAAAYDGRRLTFAEVDRLARTLEARLAAG